MTRFHLAADAVRGDQVTFDGATAHHLGRVLRAAVGELVQAVDADGQLLSVRLTAIGARRAEGVVVTRARLATESPLELTLAQAIPKGEKMETVIRMTTELGVSRVIPLITARTVVRLEPARWGARVARWQRVAKEAAQQCGRAAVPEVAPPRELAGWRHEAPADGLLICFWEEERRGLATLLPTDPVPRVTVVVGPEGGLTAGEVGELSSAGGLVAGLGPRLLRTETAGAVAVALLQSRYGDLGSA
ncbi:MAG TPA: 16S rRNA (uracil(1498)-N(3))-methyltransferase [Methylomirabilota bacterium]|nr:16S rRNA (uracil(1498)-N(3))-methyltransferase [Methylomirabilota bacterium]